MSNIIQGEEQKEMQEEENNQTNQSPEKPSTVKNRNFERLRSNIKSKICPY
jgi:hypothetical protein